MNIKSITLIFIISALCGANVWMFNQLSYHKEVLALTTSYFSMLHEAKILPSAEEVFKQLKEKKK